jgi:hypothetical protein
MCGPFACSAARLFRAAFLLWTTTSKHAFLEGMNPTLARLMSNKHTSSAGIVCFIAVGLCHILVHFFPDQAQAFRDSQRDIMGLAVTYGLIMAGDASKSAPAEPGEGTAANPPTTTPEAKP